MVLYDSNDDCIPLQGKCLDHVTVTHTHSFQQVELNPGGPGEIENMLEKLHKALHEVHCKFRFWRLLSVYLIRCLMSK